MGDAYIAVVEDDAPKIKILEEPAKWVDTTAKPIRYEFEDEGFGIRSATMSYGGAVTLGWGFDLGCIGTSAGPCPRTAKTGETKALAWYPADLPTGRDELTVTTGDILWG